MLCYAESFLCPIRPPGCLRSDGVDLNPSSLLQCPGALQVMDRDRGNGVLLPAESSAVWNDQAFSMLVARIVG